MPAPTEDVLAKFDIQGTLRGVLPLSGGNIHESWVSSWAVGAATRRYVHQRLNAQVFKSPQLLIKNHLTIWDAVCKYRPKTDLAIPKLVPLRAGGYLLHTLQDIWRTTEFIENTVAIQQCENPQQAHQAARVFARFQSILNTIAPKTIESPIPHFQNVPRRLAALRQAADQDSAGRRQECRQECELLLNQQPLAETFERGVADGSLPERVVHADLKINNVLFDQSSGQALAVIDLDACMPGTLLYDFGDFVRSAGVPCAEDEPDAGKVKVDLQLIAALIEGYVGLLKPELSAAEGALFYRAPQVVALSLASRFLADHLSGDVYFRTRFAGHNLVRARTQIQVLKSLQGAAAEMQQLVAKVLA